MLSTKDLVSTRFKHSTTHRIDYELYKAKTTLMSDYHKAKALGKSYYLRIQNTACFGSMPGHAKSIQATKIRYVAKQDPKANNQLIGTPKLSIEEVRHWIYVNRKYGMLPRAVRFTSRHWEQQIVVDLEETPMNLVYFYLTMFRYLREDSGVVKIFVHLTKNKGVNPYVALVIANKTACDFVGHSVLPVVKGYMANALNESSRFEVHMAAQLREFVAHTEKYSKNTILKSATGFRLHSTLSGIRIDNLEAEIKFADSPLITEFVMTDDVERRNVLWGEINALNKLTNT